MKTKYIIASLGLPLCSLSAQMPQYTSQRGTGAESATDGHHFVSQIGSTPMDMRQRSSLKPKKQALIAIASSN